MKAKAIIAMSGGVDSSVAALLSRDAGLDCVGVTMKLFENEDLKSNFDAAPEGALDAGPDGRLDGKGPAGGGSARRSSRDTADAGDAPGGSRACCSLRDADDAARVCGVLGIPFYVFDFTADFRRDVMERFVTEYAAGRTPNPCIDCNRFIKYDRLYRRARGMEFDFVVTGHYARVERDAGSGRWLLKKAVDDAKDQSYVLYSLTQEQLAHTRFPLGGMRKGDVREIAEKNGFVNARKRDSQDICFVPDGRYAGFIESFTGRTWPPGDFVDADGGVLGRHEGIIRYTIGQRKGLGKAFGRPVYVTGISPESNEVTLGDNDSLFSREVRMREINLIAAASLSSAEGRRRVTARIRYNQKDSPAAAERTGDDEITLTFDEPQRAVTRGQAAVMYDGDTVVGGGTIV